MEKMVEFLTVKDRFQIEGRGLIILPDFSVPKGHWKNAIETVEIETPTGGKFETTANFNLTHFKLLPPNVSLDRSWRVVVLLPKLKKEELPVGSKLFIPEKIRNALAG